MLHGTQPASMGHPPTRGFAHTVGSPDPCLWSYRVYMPAAPLCPCGPLPPNRAIPAPPPAAPLTPRGILSRLPPLSTAPTAAPPTHCPTRLRERQGTPCSDAPLPPRPPSCGAHPMQWSCNGPAVTVPNATAAGPHTQSSSEAYVIRSVPWISSTSRRCPRRSTQELES